MEKLTAIAICNPKPSLAADCRPPVSAVPLAPQFRFADGWDKLLISVGTLMSMINGTTLPLLCLVFGDMTDSFIMDSSKQNLTELCEFFFFFH